MILPMRVDRIARRAGEWLVKHNFRDTDIWPARTALFKELDTHLIKQDEAVKAVMSSVKTSPLELPLLSDGYVTAFGAYMVHDSVNKYLFTLTSYSDLSAFLAKRTTFKDARFNNITAVIRKDLDVALAAISPNHTCMWGQVLKVCPELLLYKFLEHADLKHFGTALIRQLSLLILYSKNNFEKYDNNGALLREIETELVHLICRGLHVFSFTMYQSLYAALPIHVRARVPLIQLKMKHTSENTYFYAGDGNV